MILVIDPKDERFTNPDYVRTVMLHEVAHRHQDKSDWYGDDVTPQAMGWQKAGDGWLVKGKNGELFRNAYNYGDSWIRCDKEGNAIDEHGKVVAPGVRVKCFDSVQVREAALVKPPTNYFTNPTEMMAEAIALFRGTPAERFQLRTTSPVLYDLAKKRDQMEIDGAFSKQALKGHNLRLPSGDVVPATAEAQKRISDFEATGVVSP
jgi:hypothetical protein